MDFYAVGINKLISHCQKCVDCNGSYFINKGIFESSYNDLKFRVQNRNYFCTNVNNSVRNGCGFLSSPPPPPTPPPRLFNWFYTHFIFVLAPLLLKIPGILFILRVSIPRQVDKKSRVPKEEKRVWGSQRGDRGLEFSWRRKGQTFFPFKPRANDCTTKLLTLLKDLFSLKLGTNDNKVSYWKTCFSFLRTFWLILSS